MSSKITSISTDSNFNEKHLEVAAGVVPLDLRFCEIAIRDVAKIAAKRQDDPLKIQLNKYTEEF